MPACPPRSMQPSHGAIQLRQGVTGARIAARCHEQSLALARERGHPPEIAAALAGLGQVAFARGAYEKARQFSSEALDMYEAMGARLGVSAMLRTLEAITREHDGIAGEPGCGQLPLPAR
ncbi:MAG: tetratricopeptide repeat protein [Chloroflexi bacterium]|nr:tetratricopeptide repeat protein [Chloroflexota bacterium]